jgi:hypothetical protein
VSLAENRDWESGFVPSCLLTTLHRLLVLADLDVPLRPGAWELYGSDEVLARRRFRRDSARRRFTFDHRGNHAHRRRGCERLIGTVHDLAIARVGRDHPKVVGSEGR